MFTREPNREAVPELIADLIPTEVAKLGVKVHFGRTKKDGSHVPPGIFDQVRKQVDEFNFMDTNTLYGGERSTEESHRKVAKQHGFDNVVILDQDELVDVGEHASVPGEVLDYDLILNFAHFTGHQIAGYGGCIKNIGMGLVSSGTKLWVHDAGNFSFNADKCVGCGWCDEHCENLTPSAVLKGCNSCGKCVGECNAVHFSFGKHKQVAKRLVHIADEVDQELNLLHFNFIDDPTELCDCMGDNTDDVLKYCFLLVAGDDLGEVDRTAVDFALRGKEGYKLADAQLRYLKSLRK